MRRSPQASGGASPPPEPGRRAPAGSSAAAFVICWIGRDARWRPSGTSPRPSATPRSPCRTAPPRSGPRRAPGPNLPETRAERRSRRRPPVCARDASCASLRYLSACRARARQDAGAPSTSFGRSLVYSVHAAIASSVRPFFSSALASSLRASALSGRSSTRFCASETDVPELPLLPNASRRSWPRSSPPEPTPRKTKPPAEDDDEKHERPLRLIAQAGEEHRVLGYARGAATGLAAGWASMARLALCAAAVSSCQSIPPFS